MGTPIRGAQKQRGTSTQSTGRVLKHVPVKVTWLVLGGDPAARSFFPTRAQLFGFRWARFRKLGVVLDAMRCDVVVVLMILMTTAAGGDAGSDYDWCCVL